MNEAAPRHDGVVVPEYRRAVLPLLFSHDYQRIHDRLEHPETPAAGQSALSDLQNLKARLIQEMEARKETSHRFEQKFFQDLLRSIEMDLQGFTYRQEHELPILDVQRAMILDAIYLGRLPLAEDLLETLWFQKDGRADHLKLEEELKIVEEIYEPDFEPARSFLAMKIGSNLASLPQADLHHLPLFVEKQRDLLEMLERIKPLAENRGWTFEWSSLRNHVLRSIDDIHEHATNTAMNRMRPSFEELVEARLIAEENLAELEEAQAALQNIDNEIHAQEQRQVIEELKRSLEGIYQELEILQMSLGSENIHDIEFLEEDELDQMHLEIHAELLPIESVDRTLRAQIQRAERDLMLKVSSFLTKRDAAAELRAQHGPIEAQLKFLRRKLQAVQHRRDNQELLRQMHAIRRLDIRPVRQVK